MGIDRLFFSFFFDVDRKRRIEEFLVGGSFKHVFYKKKSSRICEEMIQFDLRIFFKRVVKNGPTGVNNYTP